MSFELVKKYSDNVDELFKTESKTDLLTNSDYDWTGAHSVKVYKFSTVALNDYARHIENPSNDSSSVEAISRYGKLYDLSATTEEMLLKKDRSFIFNVDKMDADESSLSSAQALAREIREVVIPEIDTYVYNTLATNAGNTKVEVLSKTNIYQSILKGSETIDDCEVPDTDRVLVVSPSSYSMLKQAQEFDSTEIGADLRLKGVVGIIDGMVVVKVPQVRLPKNFGFMIVHPMSATAPIKLEDYNIHHDTPLSSGDIVTGRIVYDCFVLDNKVDGIYYHSIASNE